MHAFLYDPIPVESGNINFYTIREDMPECDTSELHDTQDGGRGSGRRLRQYYLKIGVIQPLRCKSAK